MNRVAAYLMHACLNMTCSEVLQLLASLDEEAAVWDADRDAPPVSQPDEEAREPGLAVDGQQIEVVMEASIAAAEDAVLAQICPCSTK